MLQLIGKEKGSATFVLFITFSSEITVSPSEFPNMPPPQELSGVDKLVAVIAASE